MRRPTLIAGREAVFEFLPENLPFIYIDVRITDVTKKYSQAKEFLIAVGKSKSSLHRLISSDFSPTTDT